MAIVDFALEHARQGRLVFPGAPNGKMPPKGFFDPYNRATTDERQIIEWWQENPNYNICLPGGYEIGPGKYLGFIDVDCKREGKNGFKSLEELDILDFTFPETLAQETPSGGLHFFYYFDFPIPNTESVLGTGIDTKGFHGHVVGAGSGINGKGYIFKNQLQIAQAPQWLSLRLRRVGAAQGSPNKQLGKLSLVNNIEQETATRSAVDYLKAAPIARAGERNRRAYEAACRLKDFGLTRENTIDCMLTHWQYEPAFGDEPSNFGKAIEQVTNSAFRYGQNSPGVLAPEATFDAIPELKLAEKPRHPIDLVNDEYALVTSGGVHIMWETKDHEGRPRREHLKLDHFHVKLANRLMLVGDKSVPVSKLWIKSLQRREYDGICFAPNKDTKKFYNLWQGFSVQLPTGEPSAAAKQGLELLLEHIHENVCGGNVEWAKWVIGFFAHLIQKPQVKPGVALVLRGKKGVGKNALTDSIFRLLGVHCILAANRRYLSGNFNSHLENKLLIVFDEAYWSGDKQAEGILKDMITGSTCLIERKGIDPIPVANLLRVVLFSNEDWVVPATSDERRFAVFNVGDKRREDRKYFGAISAGMDAGGDQLLFQYLQNFDLNTVDINVAPTTDALMSQKAHSLGPLETWWFGSLKEGQILGSSQEEWQTEIARDLLRSAFYTRCKSQNISSRLPNDIYFGRLFKLFAPSSCGEHRLSENGIRYRVQAIAPLDKARLEWEAFIGGKVDWDN